MKKMKKALAFLLALAMILTLAPATAFATSSRDGVNEELVTMDLNDEIYIGNYVTDVYHSYFKVDNKDKQYIEVSRDQENIKAIKVGNNIPVKIYQWNEENQNKHVCTLKITISQPTSKKVSFDCYEVNNYETSYFPVEIGEATYSFEEDVPVRIGDMAPVNKKLAYNGMYFTFGTVHVDVKDNEDNKYKNYYLKYDGTDILYSKSIDGKYKNASGVLPYLNFIYRYMTVKIERNLYDTDKNTIKITDTEFIQAGISGAYCFDIPYSNRNYDNFTVVSGENLMDIGKSPGSELVARGIGTVTVNITDGSGRKVAICEITITEEPIKLTMAKDESRSMRQIFDGIENCSFKMNESKVVVDTESDDIVSLPSGEFIYNAYFLDGGKLTVKKETDDKVLVNVYKGLFEWYKQHSYLDTYYALVAQYEISIGSSQISVMPVECYDVTSGNPITTTDVAFSKTEKEIVEYAPDLSNIGYSFHNNVVLMKNNGNRPSDHEKDIELVKKGANGKILYSLRNDGNHSNWKELKQNEYISFYYSKDDQAPTESYYTTNIYEQNVIDAVDATAKTYTCVSSTTTAALVGDKDISLLPEKKAGFSVNSNSQLVIDSVADNGTSEINVYYDRVVLTVTGSVDVNGTANGGGSVLYGATSTAIIFTPEKNYKIVSVTQKLGDAAETPITGFATDANGAYSYPAQSNVTGNIVVTAATERITSTQEGNCGFFVELANGKYSDAIYTDDAKYYFTDSYDKRAVKNDSDANYDKIKAALFDIEKVEQIAADNYNLEDGMVLEVSKICYYANDKDAQYHIDFRVVDPDATFTLTFDGNGADADVPSAIAGIAKGETKTIDETEIPTRTADDIYSYEFAGWGTTKDAKTTVSSIIVNRNTTVYAVWNKTALPRYAFYVELGEINNKMTYSDVITSGKAFDVFKQGYNGNAIFNTDASNTMKIRDSLEMSIEVVEAMAVEAYTDLTPGMTLQVSKIVKVSVTPQYHIDFKMVERKPLTVTSGGSRKNNNHRDNTTNIEDEKIPLAGLPVLNSIEHFNYMKGYADGTVKPENSITREEIAAIFYRLLADETKALYETSEENFSDIEDGRWSQTAIATLAKAEIIDGYNDGTFAPTKAITRAEFAAICARFDELSPSDKDMFTDISDHWAKAQINSANIKGWIGGYTDGTFRPDLNITRAEVATMINKILNRKVNEEGLLDTAKEFTDNTPDKWYYYDILEATNNHEYESRASILDAEKWTEVKADKD